MQAILRPLDSYINWVLSLRPVWLSGAVLLAPVAVVAVVLYLLLSGGGGGGTSDVTSQACTTFSSENARSYCEGETTGDVVDCHDFPSSAEATRFVLAHDPANVNKLEQAGSEYCPTLAGTSGASASPAPGSPTAAPSPTQPPAPTATPTPSTYTVVSGDNPTLIARSLGVPEDDVDAWVAELLALNGVQANALQVGQSLVLPPIGGGATAAGPGPSGPAGPTAPANTGGPTGGGNPGGTTGSANPTPTNTNVPVVVPTNTTTVPPTATSTVAPTSTTAPTATATVQPMATATLSPTPSSGGTAVFNILESSISPGGTVHWEASGFTPNDTLTIYSCYVELNFCDSTTTTTGPTGGFTDSGVVPTDAPKGTYTVQLTDGHGKTASDSFRVQ